MVNSPPDPRLADFLPNACDAAELEPGDPPSLVLGHAAPTQIVDASIEVMGQLPFQVLFEPSFPPRQEVAQPRHD